MKIVGINLDNKIHYFNSDNFNLKRNVTVIVETDRGLELGKVEFPTFESEKKIEKNSKIVRLSNRKDYQDYQKNIKDAVGALKKCKELVNKLGLNMQVIDASYNLNRSQLLFRFVSDTRIDFRTLAKELANKYKTRIELRQIGVRDKAKEVGGCGLCGRMLCCSRFGSDFTSVSINMAKNQNISLNPNKINGVCGRLLCCLRYENDNYTECRKCLPKVGQVVEVNGKSGKVTSLDIINKSYDVVLENNEVVKVNNNGSN